MPDPTRAEVEAEVADFAARTSLPDRPTRPEQTELAAPPAIGVERPEQSLFPPASPAPSPVESIVPTAATAPGATAQLDRENDPEYLRHRLSTVQGMAAKDREVMKQQIDQNAKLMTLLEQNAAAANTAPAPVIPTKAVEVTDEMVEQQYSDEQIEEFGLSMLKRDIAKDNQLAALTGQVQQLVSRDATRDQADQQDRATRDFFARVEQFVPDAERVNRLDPGWDAWLDVDYRREKMQAAMAANDHSAVATTMLQYQREKPAPGKAAPLPPGLTAGIPQTSLPSIQEQAVVTGTVANAPVTTPDVVLYTRSQVDKYYDDRARGRLDMTDAEILQVEAQIKTAGMEGRIIKG